MIRIILIFIVSILILVLIYFFSTQQSYYWLNQEQNSKALVKREDIGSDFIECIKLEMSLDEAKVAVQKLSLESMETYPKYDISAANCRIDWWDVDFPSEANWYTFKSDGKFRHLATLKNGFFYYTRELR